MSNIYKEYKPPVQSGGFTKIEDGQTVRLRIASEPVVFVNQFDEHSNPQTRYAWIVYNFTNNCAEIWAVSVTVYKMIANLGADDEWGDPTTYGIKVKREGVALQTTYQITPVPVTNKQLLPEQQEEVDKIDLLKVIKEDEKNHSVMWLSDAIKHQHTTKSIPGVKASQKVSQAATEDIVPEDIDDEAPDVSEIPF